MQVYRTPYCIYRTPRPHMPYKSQAISELLLWLTWRGIETADDGTKLDPGGCRSRKYQQFLALSDAAYSAAVSLGNCVPFLRLGHGAPPPPPPPFHCVATPRSRTPFLPPPFTFAASLLYVAPHLVDWLLYVCGISIAGYVAVYAVLFAADQRKQQQLKLN
jgi:hypothetical protein